MTNQIIGYIMEHPLLLNLYIYSMLFFCFLGIITGIRLLFDVLTGKYDEDEDSFEMISWMNGGK